MRDWLKRAEGLEAEKRRKQEGFLFPRSVCDFVRFCNYASLLTRRKCFEKKTEQR